MSGRLIKMPACWPALSLTPEPSWDPDDPARWYLELFPPAPPQVPPVLLLKNEQKCPTDDHLQSEPKPSHYTTPRRSPHL